MTLTLTAQITDRKGQPLCDPMGEPLIIGKELASWIDQAGGVPGVPARKLFGWANAAEAGELTLDAAGLELFEAALDVLPAKNFAKAFLIRLIDEAKAG